MTTFKRCVICKERFECYCKNNGHRGIQTRSIRPWNVHTCSHKCALRNSRRKKIGKH